MLENDNGGTGGLEYRRKATVNQDVLKLKKSRKKEEELKFQVTMQELLPILRVRGSFTNDQRHMVGLKIT